MRKQEKGITLIALVVTIVVLLILAAVSISMLTGENGIITQAQRAKEQTIIGEEKEAISVSYTACKTKDYSKDVISSGEMQKEINKIKNNVVVSMSGDDLVIYFQDTEHSYIVNQNGQISETDLNEDSIIDMLAANIAVTLSGKVIYIDDSQFTEGQLLELNIEDYTVITENGVRKAEDGIFIDNEGKVYTWGDNYYGELGDGTTEVGYDKYRKVPMCISDLDNVLKGKKIVEIYEDSGTIFAIDTEGKIYTWGRNDYGQLGDGTINNRNTPICISELENDMKEKIITNIYKSFRTIFALDTEGKIYVWGENDVGQLGDGTTNNSNIPICISELENDLKGKKIANIYEYGSSTIFAIDTEGKIYTWGRNNYGQLGDGTNNNRNNPICISELENDLKGKRIANIIYDGSTTFALDTEGKVYSWGYNYYGQLGDGTNNKRNTPICISELENDLKGKRIAKIYESSDTIFALDTEGKIYTWGYNSSGKLGDGTNNNRNNPICISELENDLKGKKIANIYEYGSSTIFAIDTEGKIYAWGRNDDGQLGDGTNNNRNTPICISELENDLKEKRITNIYEYSYDDTIFVLDAKGKVYTWGRNGNTPICISDAEGNSLNGEKIKKYCNVSFASSSSYNTGYCFVSQDGKVYYYYMMGVM